MPRKMRKKPKLNFWMITTAILAIALVLSLTQGWSLTPTGHVVKETVVEETGEQAEEMCPCGCNMVLDTCQCATARGIRGGQQPTKPEGVQPVEVDVDDDPAIGPADAPVTIVEFSDYQCPFCARAEATIKQILNTYGGKVRFVYRDFPLGFHQYAKKAAEASECADEQGKFWAYHDLLFANQQALDIDSLKGYAADLGLDLDKFNECLDTGRYASEVEHDMQEGQSYGVRGTPAFFINGHLVSGAQPFSVFKEIIDRELEK